MLAQLTKQTTADNRCEAKDLVRPYVVARPEDPKRYIVTAWYTTELRRPEGYRVFKWSVVVGAGNIEEAMVEGFAVMDIGVDDVLHVEVGELPE